MLNGNTSRRDYKRDDANGKENYSFGGRLVLIN
jgi:hypothetical protein